MKRALRIIVPILLAVAVILSIGWYFVKYDPDLTRDVLVSQARALDGQGNHTLATWFYNLAYQQSGNDETIALELAQQYQSMGNYTKAEYTLSNAIADGGSAELYIALCNLYVQQDKLLDAVTMLDNIADPVIKSQLDELRPQAPIANREPGFYNEYISVSFSAPEGIIYLTNDGRYPTNQDAPHTSAVALPAGETVFHCLSVGENGLVSPLSVTSYTVAGVIEAVVIEDAAIDQAIREQLQVDEDHVLYSNELWTITSLTVPRKAESLSDLIKLPFLQRLTIANQEFESLSPLSALASLEELHITETPLTEADLQTIAALPKLNVLTMNKCNLSSIGPLKAATGLTRLDLGSNTIRDLTALEGMTELTYLNLNHNAVTELISIAPLTKLTDVDLSYNSIGDASPLGSCTELVNLKLAGNLLVTANGLEKLTALQTLSLAFNDLTDISALSANTGLTELDISNNELTDILSLSALTQLRSLNFSYNQVEKLPAFEKDSPLVTIKGSQNKLTSLDELAGLECLNYVIMDFNEGITSVNSLAGCYLLVEVSVYGTGVREVDALTDMGVIVKYRPI